MKKNYHSTNLHSFKEPEGIFNPGRPFQVIHRLSAHPAMVPMHYHQMLEIIIWNGAQGSGIFESGELDISKASVFVIHPGMPHGFRNLFHSKPVHVIQISLPAMLPVFDAEAFAKYAGVRIDALPVTSIVYEKELAAFNFLSEAAEKDPVERYRFLNAVLCVLYSAAEKSPNVIKTDPFLTRIISWTEHHAAESIRLSQAAAAAEMTEPSFCRKFKSKSGMTFGKYLTLIRLERAAKLLREGALVTDAAFGAGFNDTSYFIQIFKRNFGITPHCYARSRIQ